MASPDVFRSPSSRTPQRESKARSSSSPEFPSLKDIATNSPSRPPFHTPSKAKRVPGSHRNAIASAVGKQPDEGKDISVISLHSSDDDQSREAGVNEKKGRKPSAPRSKYFADDQPWKKFKSPPKITTHGGHGQSDDHQAGPSASPTREVAHASEQDASLIMLEDNPTLEHIEATRGSDRPRIKEQEEPLYLELAPGRRPDWTPPTKTVSSYIDLRSDSSAVKDASASTQVDNNSDVFKNLLQTYGCDIPQPEQVVVSEEDSSFLKKRKMIELVATTDGAQSPPVSPDKTRPKKKATKKKPRTITELATAAYQPFVATDAIDSTQSQLPFVRAEITQDAEATNKNGKGKAKAKPARKSKKVTAKSKKKVEHTLLSPGTALKQSAAQDFLFGTSSQLAREQSPTLLRDIQTAMRNSNLDTTGIDETDPFFNSDDMEPVIKRHSLWEAAARDDGGGLLDIELVDLANEPSQIAHIDKSGDPFGYSRLDGGPALQEHGLGHGDSNASFETLSDILPAPKTKAPDIDENSVFSLSDISVSTDIRKPDLPSTVAHSRAAEEVTEFEPAASIKPTTEVPQRPEFELCTDAQLAKQIKGYGFKAVKRRSAMIGLLEQCWRSKHGISENASRMRSTSSAASQPRKEPQAVAVAVEGSSPKKTRGRPRKTPSSPVMIQEPPPSAQPIESPKRPRGRPKKTEKAVAAPDEGTVAAAVRVSPKKSRSRSLKKATESEAETAPAKPSRKPKQASTNTKTTLKTTSALDSTPVRKRAAKFQDVLEIPDSASDQDSDRTVFSASPEPTFSPSPEVDMSVSMEEDASLIPSGSPNALQSSVFERITEAVTTAPRSTDPQNPSWYEKILMYDPIILEDLASWLNSGQLSRVGHDDEVSPGEVKKWCESQSVCCLWRLNLRGVSRKRY